MTIMKPTLPMLLAKAIMLLARAVRIIRIYAADQTICDDIEKFIMEAQEMKH